ncbi:MAG TPA: DUF3108 domain-containing protein [Gammaproteobacteria bacterium]
MMRWTLSLLALLPVAASAAAMPPEFTALYDFERGRLTIGETRMGLERSQDDIYRYWSEAKATGFISIFVDDVIREESLFRFEDGRLWPVSYEYRQLNSSKNRNEDIVYDWTDGIAKVNYRGHESTLELKPGTLDRFLMQLAISLHSQDGKLDRDFRIIDNSRIKTYRLQGQETETIETPAGTFETLRIERVDEDSDKKIRLWLAPELGYLPVKIEQEKLNEETLRLVLKKVESEK